MVKETTIELIRHDLSKLTHPSVIGFVRYLIMNASFKTTFWFRVLSGMKGKKWLKPLYGLVYMYYKHVQYLTGIQLNIGTQIGGGIRFAHYSCIIINEYCKIGHDVTIFQGVTIGGSRGKGIPTIGNNVVLAAGAIVIGNVNIGNDVFIGAGAVVTKNVEDGAVVVGNPARVINYNGAEKVAAYNQRY